MDSEGPAPRPSRNPRHAPATQRTSYIRCQDRRPSDRRASSAAARLPAACPGDQRPVFVQPKWDHCLIDFEGVLGGFVGTIQKIRLVAQRQCDLTGHGVFRILGQLGVAQRHRRLRHGLPAPQCCRGEDDPGALVHLIKGRAAGSPVRAAARCRPAGDARRWSDRGIQRLCARRQDRSGGGARGFAAAGSAAARTVGG